MTLKPRHHALFAAANMPADIAPFSRSQVQKGQQKAGPDQDSNKNAAHNPNRLAEFSPLSLHNPSYTMLAAEFRESLVRLGFSQTAFAKFARIDDRSVRRWISGETPVPGWVPVMLRLIELAGTVEHHYDPGH